jgi:hypothetical protein
MLKKPGNLLLKILGSLDLRELELSKEMPNKSLLPVGKG